MRDAGCCWIFDIGYWILDSRQVVSSGMLLDTGPRIWRGRLLDIGFLITEIFFMTYKDLEIWKLAREVVIEVHDMTLKLPRFEMFEEGAQIRRSCKTTKSAIVEGYGRRRYKQDWMKFLIYSLSSNYETLDHLETLWETKSLTNEVAYTKLHNKIERLGKMTSSFLSTVELQHLSPK